MFLNTSDSLFRAPLNETFINLYSFFWTNFWYLPIFWLCICFISLFFSIPNLHSILFYYIILYSYEFFDLNTSSCTNSTMLASLTVQNPFLGNSINKYHPFMFYSAVIILLLQISLISPNLACKTRNWNLEKTLYTQRLALLLDFLVLFCTLYLGSWWALQEGTWGGWWNWDASETFGLLLCFRILKFLHISKKIHKVVYTTYLMLRTCGDLIFLYFLMQLNFDLISHNFGIKFFFFFNNSFFMIEALFFTHLFLTYWALKYRITIFSFSCLDGSRKTNKVPLVFKSVVYFFLTLWVFLVSFGPVLTYFCWNFLQINLLNELGSHLFLNFSGVIFLLATYFLKIYTKYLCILSFFLLQNSNWLLVIFCLFFFNTFFQKLHWIFFIFFYNNVTAYVFQLLNLELKSENLPILYFLDVIWGAPLTTTLDVTLFATTVRTYINTSLNFSNTETLVTLVVNPFFSFVLSSFNCLAFLWQIGGFSHFLTLIELPLLAKLPLISYVGLGFFLKFFFVKSQKIIF